MKRKTTVSILSFLVLFSLVFIYLNEVFKSEHHYINTSEDFTVLAEKTNIDVIFYGSSHSYTAFNPLIVDDICKTVSYNLGSDALKVELTDLVLVESLKKTKPKLVILEVYPPTLRPVKGKEDKAFHLRAMDVVPNVSLLKAEKTLKIYEPKEYLGVMFPLIRNHSKWKTNKFFNLSRRKKLDSTKNYFYGGFIGAINVMSLEEQEKYKDFNKEPLNNDPNRSWLTDLAKEDIKRFVDLAKNTGAEVLIVSSPDPRARVSFNYYIFSELETLCHSLDISFLNLNDYLNEMNLNVIDFKDNSHLNTYGSTKATMFLANYIKEHYSLKDRSTDDVWKFSQKKHAEFKNMYSFFKPVSFKRELNETVLKFITIKELEILSYQKEKLNFRVKLDSSFIGSGEENKYRLAIHIYPKDDHKEMLSDRNKSIKRNYDLDDFVLDGKNNFSLEINTKIKNIKKIELFLFDKDGYKGVIGERVKIKDIFFQSRKN
ncbi:hypothetical protein ABXT64_05370 [Candidatus Marifrigoribacter sp. Uisw_064]|jgi:hypothetical protein|uniref:hypothetical protein n=1 Tax=Candidatus Marifrigoribacter sp. Uisw_064 TaxID=3230970 RepID=UPI003D4805CE